VDPKAGTIACVCEPGWTGIGCDVASSSIKTVDVMDTGLIVGMVFLFLFIGVLTGILAKRQWPGLCARDSSSGATGGLRTSYNTLGDTTDA
jgi:hypothetical protein